MNFENEISDFGEEIAMNDITPNNKKMLDDYFHSAVKIEPNIKEELKKEERKKEDKEIPFHVPPHLASLFKEFFKDIKVDEQNISATCCLCSKHKVVRGHKSSSANWKKHMKRLHPSAMNKVPKKLKFKKQPTVNEEIINQQQMVDDSMLKYIAMEFHRPKSSVDDIPSSNQLSGNQCVAIETFLDQNPSFLQSYVLNHVSWQTVREWELALNPTSLSSTSNNNQKSQLDVDPSAYEYSNSTISRFPDSQRNYHHNNPLPSREHSMEAGPVRRTFDSRLLLNDEERRQLFAGEYGGEQEATSPGGTTTNSKSNFPRSKSLFTGHSIGRNSSKHFTSRHDHHAKMYLNNMDKLQMVLKQLSSNDSANGLLFQLISSISKLIGATISNLYVPTIDGEKLEHIYSHGNNNKLKFSLQTISERKTATTFSAATKQTILIKKYSPMSDDRFPEGVNDSYYDHDIGTVLIQPIITETEEILGIMEFIKFSRNDVPFMESDIEIIGTCLLFGLVSFHFLQRNRSLLQQKKLNEFLLKVTSSIFQDMESIATLIFKIMKFGRKLVNADRASLFLVDRQNQELYASIFDVGGQHETEVVPIEKEKIRFPIGTGIAGSVAKTGRIENIKDAYLDERFNKNVDIMTGYQTKTILCMPIYIRKEIIGVMQMVNKKDSLFNETDEKNFEAFAIYCGLALYHAQLYEKIYRSEKKYKVALEVLSYHITANREEIDKLLSRQGLPDGITEQEINSFDFDHDVDKKHNDLKPELVLYMYTDLFGDSRQNNEFVARFILTVKKNYRNVPYHNWTHGFYVAQAAYVILKLYPEKFDVLECLALFIASLCHDLDHRGKNNTFMKETDTPLAAIYTTSTMEHHHFNQTVAILQQEGHNIFADLTSTDYRKVLGLIKHCILATDLAQFFTFKAALTKRLDSGEFSWEDHHDKMLALAIIMTSCDLCASAKPWKFQQETVAVIMEEFFQQGDAEKTKGKVPIPLMDRNCADQLPKNQVGFIKGLCVPCYEVLIRIFPLCTHLLDGAKKNCVKWSEFIKE